MRVDGAVFLGQVGTCIEQLQCRIFELELLWGFLIIKTVPELKEFDSTEYISDVESIPKSLNPPENMEK